MDEKISALLVKEEKLCVIDLDHISVIWDKVKVKFSLMSSLGF